jgi:hypothetical protein
MSELLYTLDDAMAFLLIPTKSAMYALLWRHREHLDRPRRYAYHNSLKRQRLLTAREVAYLRDHRRIGMKGALRWMLTEPASQA